MPFENFYKAADQYSHRLRLCLIAAVLFIAAYFTVPFFLMSLFETPPSLPFESAVSEAARRDADLLCRNLPKPESFSLASVVEKKETADGAATVVYTYTSGRGFDEILPPMLIWFENERWQQVPDEISFYVEIPDRAHSFRNRNRHVSVLYFERRFIKTSLRFARYEIICTVEKLQPRD